MDEGQVRGVLAEHAGLRVDAAGVDAAADLYALGMTSHASVRVMLALEDAADVEIPDRFLTKESFASVGAILAMMGEIDASAAAS
jgi:acyl carrier protein